MMQGPDYTKYTLDELYRCTSDIDRAKYADRHRNILDQIRIHEENIGPQALRLRDQRKLRVSCGILGFIITAQASLGFLLTFAHLISHTPTPWLQTALFLSVILQFYYIGIMLFIDRKWGLFWAMILQIIQIPAVVTSSMTFSLGLGITAIFPKLHFSDTSYIGVNFIAAALLWLALILRNHEAAFNSENAIKQMI